LDISLRGTMGLSKRTTWVGTRRALTHLLFHSILFYTIHQLNHIFRNLHLLIYYNTKALLVSSYETGLVVNADKTKKMVISQPRMQEEATT